MTLFPFPIAPATLFWYFSWIGLPFWSSLVELTNVYCTKCPFPLPPPPIEPPILVSITIIFIYFLISFIIWSMRPNPLSAKKGSFLKGSLPNEGITIIKRLIWLLFTHIHFGHSKIAHHPISHLIKIIKCSSVIWEEALRNKFVVMRCLTTTRIIRSNRFISIAHFSRNLLFVNN